MHRLIVALLASVDAVIAAAVGLAVTLAPLTLLWVFGFGGGADWGVLWPSAVSVWQLGNLVPLTITLPPDYLAATGIDAGAASFVLSLAPLAFAGFTAIFAARSGARASHADAWLTGVLTSSAVFALVTTGAALTGANDVARAETWQAILVPTLVFALPALVAAVVTEWSEAGSGAIARLRDRVEAVPHGWGEVPALVARGTAVVVVGLVGVGAAVAAVALFARAGQIVALFQAGDVDPIGATVITLAQLAYVPTLAVWGMSFVAGPGFAVGTGTAVSPAGTQVGVIPGLPVLGAVPESTTSWLLLLALLPIALGALAGWIARSRLLHARGSFRERSPHPLHAALARRAEPPGAWAQLQPAPAAGAASSRFDAGKTAALSGLLSGAPSEEPGADAHLDAHVDAPEDPIGARLVVTAGIALLSGGAAALLAWAASGSLGPGRLAEFGPDAGPVALAVGLEVLLGAAILLLSPRSAGGGNSAAQDSTPAAAGVEPATADDGPHPEPPEAAAFAAVAAFTARRSGAVAAEEDEERHPSPPARGSRSTPLPDAGGGVASEAMTEPIELPRSAPPGVRDGSD
ncbi:hypothetical protein ASF40_15695 [Microbacterium sp. Leaf288]|uniref:cell division protein PerM n=1 Tax=Microbacterium sp. Leaf288 TaxID=1736323 RepID=UPI0006F6053A|nr:DUF6350 family protein [Microbacterium sp. Leaf288]KQP69333.1 hypothetical protein ASF40_15695 [Microbacterium sp. Leaf288]